ncbi:divalent-cation tolerance protein CutA [Streptomyces sp. NPDC050439]|uniref:divalent-cation tolerance protein CutA n=1 Tax=unclassified Streptomyces TaxID=2593676 RepID=UPI00342BAB39
MSDFQSSYLQVATATETRSQAVELARHLVRQRLAAGAQIIGPVTSAFWHDGEFGTGEEYQLLLKTRSDLYPRLEAAVLEHHPWQSPELTATAYVDSSPGFRAWVDKTLS